MISTARTTLSNAEICRTNGWGPGTILYSEEPAVTSIRITAIGVRQILAVDLGEETEVLFDLHGRDWMEVR